MFESFTWRQGSGESDVVGKFADLGKEGERRRRAEPFASRFGRSQVYVTTPAEAVSK